jgi:hypothetical protein
MMWFSRVFVLCMSTPSIELHTFADRSSLVLMIAVEHTDGALIGMSNEVSTSGRFRSCTHRSAFGLVVPGHVPVSCCCGSWPPSSSVSGMYSR